MSGHRLSELERRGAEVFAALEARCYAPPKALLTPEDRAHEVKFERGKREGWIPAGFGLCQNLECMQPVRWRRTRNGWRMFTPTEQLHTHRSGAR